MYIATLNVLTLRTSNHLIEFDKALDEIKWGVIGLSEIRRLGDEIEEYDNYILYYKGVKQGLYGVGFIVRKQLKNKIESFHGISDRVAILNIKLAGYDEPWTIIQVYGPTETSDESLKDQFYEDLNSALQQTHKNIIVMGDFNSQIGKRRQGEENVIGNYSTGKRNKNGQRLVNFILENNFTILNTLFKKKLKNRWTWISPCGKYRNEIDYILTNKPKFFTNTEILSVNYNTNHRMVRATLYSKKPKQGRKHIKQPMQIINLPIPDNILENLKTALADVHKQKSVQDKYDKLVYELQHINSELSTFSKVKDKLGTKAVTLIKERRNMLLDRKNKEKEIVEISKKIRQEIRAHKNKSMTETFMYHIQRTGGVKKGLKELREKTTWIPNISDKNLKITAERPKIMNVATEFYRHLYSEDDNAPQSQSHSDNELQQCTCEEEMVPEILESEIRYAIKTQKNDKAPGEDGIRNELLKGTLEAITEILVHLFNLILIRETIPVQWTQSTIILLHKKGDKSNIENYRPISLLSNLYKIFAKVILNRISLVLDENQPREQAGFRSNFSTVDHIHVVKQLLEKCKEYNKSYYISFVDYNKAFDSLKHKAIWETLKSQGVHCKYINLIKNIYKNSTSRIRLESIGEWFKINKGVRQGDPLSPKLFAATLESVFKKLQWESFGISINGVKLNNLRFADDLVIFAEDAQTLGLMLQQLADESGKVGLTMSTTKTKIMSNANREKIYVNQLEIEYVNEYVYLGQIISPNDQNNKEVDRRVCNTWKRFWALKEVMKNRDIPMTAKTKLHDTCILPCMIYGCQTWALTKRNMEKLETCQHGIERSILHIKRKDRQRLVTIRAKTKIYDVKTKIREQKWRWCGHMARNKFRKWTNDITDWYPRDGKRKRGRQHLRWVDDIESLAGTTWQRKAIDRKIWKGMEEAYVRRHTGD